MASSLVDPPPDHPFRLLEPKICWLSRRIVFRPPPISSHRSRTVIMIQTTRSTTGNRGLRTSCHRRSRQTPAPRANLRNRGSTESDRRGCQHPCFLQCCKMQGNNPSTGATLCEPKTPTPLSTPSTTPMTASNFKGCLESASTGTTSPCTSTRAISECVFDFRSEL